MMPNSEIRPAVLAAVFDGLVELPDRAIAFHADRSWIYFEIEGEKEEVRVPMTEQIIGFFVANHLIGTYRFRIIKPS